MKVRLRAIAVAVLSGMLAGVLAPVAALAQAPAQPPAQGPSRDEPPPPPPPVAAPTDPADLKPEELTLTARPIIALKGNGTWDTAYETLIDAFKSLYAYLDKNGIKRAGPSMTIYTQADDTGFSFQAAVPVEGAPKDAPTGDISLSTSPAGKAFKFIHRGPYDSMDATYEAITNYLDDKQLEAQDLFIEEYQTDPVSTPEDDLIVNVLVPIK